LPFTARGKGRTVYFANPMDALFYRYGTRPGRVLANAVRHTLADALPLKSTRRNSSTSRLTCSRGASSCI
jgi:hypothetical protein